MNIRATTDSITIAARPTKPQIQTWTLWRRLVRSLAPAGGDVGGTAGAPSCVGGGGGGGGGGRGGGGGGGGWGGGGGLLGGGGGGRGRRQREPGPSTVR